MPNSPANKTPLIAPVLADFGLIAMHDHEFLLFQEMVERVTGISLAPIKKAMLSGRLAKRLRDLNVDNYADYFRLITGGNHPDEWQLAIDLITTNETYFFREPKHFDALREAFLPNLRGQHPVRVWSAACSSGEETYSIAMTLAEVLGDTRAWEVVGSDLSSRMLQTARRGLYPIDQAHHIPPSCLKQYCLRGTGDYMGSFLVEKSIRQRVKFQHLNLIEPIPNLGKFDAVFLRNVIIYFDVETKRRVVKAVSNMLKPGGWLVVGHSEALIGLPDDLEAVRPTVYRKRS